MAFENITLFEIELPEFHFGRQTAAAQTDHEDEMDVEETGGRGRFLPVLLIALMVVGASVLYRRSRSADVEMDVESDATEADLAEAE